VAVLTGLTGYFLTEIIHSSILDPLIVALILGIVIKSTIGAGKKLEPGIIFASSISIPVGIIFYGLQNLNFTKLTELESTMLFLLMLVMFVYFAVILLLGKLLGQKKQITYLTASGSAICGASAIAVTTPAIDAEPDDVSISLLSVTVAAFVGFSIILPFVAALFDLTGKNYSFLSGTVLQFTGLVKVAEKYTPFLRKDAYASEMMSLALSVKAVRYLALLVAVPVFSSLIKKKLSAPWFLWAFLAAGLIGTWIYSTQGTIIHLKLARYIQPVHTISWSIAMSAIGLNADARELFSNNGAKALIMAFAGFIAATLTFLAGLYIISYI
jgi:uncharacterized integral membrane protein (TIGR00698 family)